MESLNLAATELLAAYNSAMGLDLAMNGAFERWLVDASNAGLTSENFEWAIRARQKFNAQGGFRRGVMLHHFVLGEDAIAITLNEAAVVRAAMRVKVIDPAKVSVLAATGRPATAPETSAKHVADVELIQQLKRAAQ